MKSAVMKKAWEMFKKGYNKTFALCLKGAWALLKKVKNYHQGKTVEFEILDKKMVKDRDFKHSVNKTNLIKNCTYPREKSAFMTFTLKTWVKPGIARIYIEKYVDEFYFDTTYVETRI